MDTSQIGRGILDHAKWKNHLFDAVKTGKSESTVQDTRSDNQCEFGKWLASLPPSEKSSEHCQKVKALHAEFHKAASEVLELALSARMEEAEAAIAVGSRFSLISASLTMAMSAWKSATRGN
jgi:hypothetical protein